MQVFATVSADDIVKLGKKAGIVAGEPERPASAGKAA
jgi:hypothetical protein